MTSTQFVALGVRLFCVWLAVYLLRDIPGLWLLNTREFHDMHAGIAILIVTAIYVAILLVLWIFPLSIARRLLPSSVRDHAISLPAADQIERAGFCLLGLWLLTRAIPGLIFEGIVFYQYTRPGSTLGLRPQEYAALAEVTVELLLGVWLLFGTKGLSGIIRWARTAGTRSIKPESDI